MAQTSIAQINVRLSRELKEAGDSGLQELGLSPSDAVRALWMRLSLRGEELDEARAFLLGDSDTDPYAKVDVGQSALVEGWRMVDQSIAKLGIGATLVVNQYEGELATNLPANDNDLVAQALEERMQERGLM